MPSGTRMPESRVRDRIAGPQELGNINIYERILDTGNRTVVIDNISTISVGTRTYRLLRWSIWALAACVALLSLNGLLAVWFIAADAGRTQTAIFLASAIGYAAIGLGLVFLGRWFSDTNVLIIGSNDGTRTIFKSRDIGYLHEVKNFLARKINERDPTQKLAADFGNAASYSISENVYGSGQETTGRKSLSDHDHPGHGQRDELTEDTSHAGVHVDRPLPTRSPVGRLANGTEAAFNSIPADLVPGFGYAQHVDFSHVLPQIVELHRFYAQHPDMDHIEQRLSELELLMRSGAAAPEHRRRIYTLATELGSYLHSYPSMTQLFGQIAQMV